MELRDYWRALRNRWRVFLFLTLFGVFLGSVASLLLPRTYEARSELFVAPEVGSTTVELMEASTFTLNRVKSYVEIVDDDLILQPVITELGLQVSVEDLAERVSASVIPETVVISITAQDESPEVAAQIANAAADQFAALAPQLEPGADQNAVVQVTVVDPATIPDRPASPNAVLLITLGLLVGLAAGLATAVGRELLDRRIKRESDVREITSVPVVGHVPADPKAREPLLWRRNANGIRAEALRRVRTNLQFLGVPRGGRSYLITSSLENEGKTVTAINLAWTLAETGQRVCLVEADLRNPRAGQYLGIGEGDGLTSVLIGKAGWAEVVQSSGEEGLDVILAGTIPPNPSELLSSGAMEGLVQELEAAYDVVILDSAPLLPVTDAAVLARVCAGTIVVLALGSRSANRQDLRQSLDSLAIVEARVLGIVLNKLPLKGPDAVTVRYPDGPDDASRHGAERGRAQAAGSPAVHPQGRVENDDHPAEGFADEPDHEAPDPRHEPSTGGLQRRQ